MSDEPLVASSTVEEQAPPPEKLTGISVYPGIAYGLCQQFSAGDLEIPQFVIEKTGTRGEIQRLRAAIATVDKQLGALIDSADEDMPAEAAAFIDVHRTILRDPTLIEETVDIIKEKLVNAEWALSLRLEKTRRDFESIEDDYIRERIKDIAHVVLRVQRVLTGRRSASSLLEAEGLDETIILVASSIPPTCCFCAAETTSTSRASSSRKAALRVMPSFLRARLKFRLWSASRAPARSSRPTCPSCSTRTKSSST